MISHSIRLLANIDWIDPYLSSFLHDLGIKKYKKKTNCFIFIVYRPCYEEAEKTRFLGLIPVWKVPIKETVIQFKSIESVVPLKENQKRTDWFLTFEVEKETKAITIVGVMDSYKIVISNNTMLNVYDGKYIRYFKTIFSGKTVNNIKNFVAEFNKLA